MALEGDLTSQAKLTCEVDLASGVLLIGEVELTSEVELTLVRLTWLVAQLIVEVKPKLVRSIWLLRVRLAWDKLGYHDIDLKLNFFDLQFL